MTTWITVCDTCKREDWAERRQSETDGATLAAAIEAVAAGREGIAVRRHSCLMGCTNACNVTIQGRDKLNYTLGSFDADADGVAQGIVDYAALHSQSERGQVPYRQWPVAIKGHFVTRHPPLPGDDDA